MKKFITLILLIFLSTTYSFATDQEKQKDEGTDEIVPIYVIQTEKENDSSISEELGKKGLLPVTVDNVNSNVEVFDNRDTSLYNQKRNYTNPGNSSTRPSRPKVY